MQLRDIVLEGASPIEIEALERLAEQPDLPLSSDLAERLQAKGWIDTVGHASLLTIAGRTLVEGRCLRGADITSKSLINDPTRP